jgi:hypothetical protein
MKTLKQTSFGRKVYENLMTNYGDYFQQNSNNNGKYKIQDGRRKSNMETVINFHEKLEK